MPINGPLVVCCGQAEDASIPCKGVLGQPHMVARRGLSGSRSLTPEAPTISLDLYRCISDWLENKSGGTHSFWGVDETG